ncbi:MAG: hypothetical protein FWG89_06490 [Treponema sp.]|nr:hypothetical protein [Treponema sp.]
MDSREWINSVREIRKYNDDIFSLNSGHWKVKGKIKILLKYASFFYDSHLDSIKNISLKVLSEIHPMFDLVSEDRFAFALHGKHPKYSSELRKGISETLAFLGIHGKELKNCTPQKPEGIVILAIRELFLNKDWQLWASLDDVLPILAEAAPDEFLSSVENALKQSPCPFDALYIQEGDGITGANYMTGLYWALETLAWSEDLLARTILVLAELAARDPGGKWSNRPDNSIITILLPWLPQTIAPIEKRLASLKGVQRNLPDIAWKILIELLPKRHQTSCYTRKPKFRNFIPADWEEGVLRNEYWEQVNKYAAMTIDMVKNTKNDIQYISELVDNLENIPRSSYDVFLQFLSSDDIVKLPDKQKVTIWEKMCILVRRHRNYFDAERALPVEQIDLLEQTAEKLAPANPEYLYRHLFFDSDLELKGKNEEWDIFQERMKKQRIMALQQIYGINKTDSVVLFAEIVENPAIVGDTFAYIANEKNDSELLPSFLDYDELYLKQLISGYIWTRYRNNGLKWIESLKVINWTNEQKCNFLLFLPFEDKIWEKAEEFLGEHVGEYWKKINANINPIAQNNILHAIENLSKYGRPRFAFSCIYAHYHSKKELYKELAIKTLLDGVSSDESIGSIYKYQVTEIIKLLQGDIDIDENKLFKIEWAYLPFLNDYYYAEPKLLGKYLSQKPDFFIEIIQLLYRSKKDGKSDKKATKKNKNLLENAWKLLHEWKLPPGKLDDGSFSDDVLRKWVNEVKIKTIESGYFEAAMTHLGHVLFYTGPDKDGLWIQQPALEILDEKNNEHIRRGFLSEVYNSRGIYFIDPSGKPEKELADSWRKRAEEVEKLGYIHFASSLKELAYSYEREADRVIMEHIEEIQ